MLINSSPATDASTPGANRVGAERRPDRLLLQIRERRRQGARVQDEREIRRFLLREPARDLAVGRNPPVDPRRRLHRLVEHDGEETPDVLARHARERRRARGIQREADSGQIVLVELDSGGPEILARHGCDTANEIVGRVRRWPRHPARSGFPCSPARRRRCCAARLPCSRPVPALPASARACPANR